MKDKFSIGLGISIFVFTICQCILLMLMVISSDYEWGSWAFPGIQIYLLLIFGVPYAITLLFTWLKKGLTYSLLTILITQIILLFSMYNSLEGEWGFLLKFLIHLPIAIIGGITLNFMIYGIASIPHKIMTLVKQLIYKKK